MNSLAECAPKVRIVGWHQINWSQCHKTVKRLQRRIVKAKQEGRHNKVKALQWILTNSYSAKAIAVKRVTENRGKRTPGVDGVLWSTPQSKSQGIVSLSKRGYEPRPLRRVYIEKSNGKLRPLSIPTMRDRAMQALYLQALEPLSECQADPNSYGFRTERSTQDAIAQCFTTLSQKTSARWIFEADIQGCFDNISREWLLSNIFMDKTILEKWLKCGVLENNSFKLTDKGTPQGGIISPCLMNITLDGLETQIRKLSFTGNPEKLNFVRFADDFIITAKSKEILEQQVKPVVEKFLAERGLLLSPEKTHITHIDAGFDFLGQNVRKYGGKLLITPSKKNIKSFLDKVRATIKENKTVKQETLVKLLNPIIRGWANYHSGIVAKKTYNQVDNEIWKELRQWEKRRHPNKTIGWIRQKYTRSIGNRNGVFACLTDEGKLVELISASSTPIKRHVKLKAEANPFDPKWDNYFEKRGTWKIKRNLAGNKKLLTLWFRQKGTCPICSRRLSTDDEFDIHHQVPRSLGGSNDSSNLMILHPNCHRQHHHPSFKVAIPA